MKGLTINCLLFFLLFHSFSAFAQLECCCGESTDLIVNGDFEAGPAPNPGVWIDYRAGESFGNWTVSTGSVSHHHWQHNGLGNGTANGGLAHLDLNGFTIGGIEQVVMNMELGITHRLSFDYALHNGASNPGSAIISLDVLNETVSATNVGSDTWLNIAFEFVPTNTSGLLSFLADSGPNCCGFMIDNVKLEACPIDEGPPVILNPTEDLEISCGDFDSLDDWLNNNGFTVVEDDCTEVSITNNWNGSLDSCQQFTVNFFIEDECDNLLTTAATVTVIDSLAPQIIEEAFDLDLGCDPEAFESQLIAWLEIHAGASLVDNCGEVCIENDYSGINPDGMGLVNFLAYDGCGNETLFDASYTYGLPSDTTTISSNTCDVSQVGVRDSLYTNTSGCDSIVIETIILLESDTTQILSTSCDINQVGIIENLLSNSLGCDSLVIETTTFLESDITEITNTSCDPDQVGTTEIVLNNSLGCDSTVITTTTFLESDITEITNTSCDPNQVGTTEIILSNSLGCDSTVITTTIFLESDITEITNTSCDPNQVGTTEIILSNSLGCDSTVITTTTFLESDITEITNTSCDPDQVGTIEIVLSNSFGCDSTVITTTIFLESDITEITNTSCDPNQVGTTEIILSNSLGCDSTVITTTTFLESDITEITNTSCDPDQVGTIEIVLSNSFGCDSTVITNTTFLESDITEISNTSCDPNEVGTTEIILSNSLGCDSTVITTTTFLESDITEIENSSCDPDQVGTTEIVLSNSLGCDSTVITTTSFLESDITEIENSSCDPDQVGTSEIVLSNSFGCDSTVIETITFLESDTTRILLQTCDVDESGTTERTYSNVNGCDSIVITRTVLFPSNFEEVFLNSCDPLDEGTVQLDLLNQFGCDSIIIINTALLPSSDTILYNYSCNEIEIGTETIFEINQYGCDSTVQINTLLLESDTSYIFESSCDENMVGLFESVLQNEDGCDSLIVLRVDLLDSNITYLEENSCIAPLANDTIFLFNQFGCDSLVVYEFNYTSIEFDVIPSNAICKGDENGSIEIIDIANGQPPYQFSLDGVNFQSNTLIENLAAGMYDVIVIDKEGCEEVISVEINEETPSLDISLGPNQEVLAGSTIQLNLSSNFNIEALDWSYDFNCQNCLDPSLQVFNDTLISVIAYDENGCQSTTDILLKVFKETDIYIPNVFSPNSDGINDVFYIYSNELVIKEISQLSIYDRWGNKVFEKNNFPANDPSFGWDGFFRSEKMNVGVFVYWTKVILENDEEIILKGDLTLLY